MKAILPTEYNRLKPSEQKRILDAMEKMHAKDRNNEETPSILLIDKLGREVWAFPERCEVVTDGMGK